MACNRESHCPKTYKTNPHFIYYGVSEAIININDSKRIDFVFIIYFPQEADSYYVALDQSSDFEIYDHEGHSKVPDNVNISLANIAGCSNMRMRYVYSTLNGAYLAKIVNYSSNSVKVS